MRTRLLRTATCTALCAAALAAATAPPALAASSWTATPAPTLSRLFPDGTRVVRTTSPTQGAVRYLDGRTRPIPDGWSVGGASDGGALFLSRELVVFGRRAGSPPEYVPFPGNFRIHEFAWLEPDGRLRRIAATPGPTYWLAPLFDPENTGVVDGGVFRLMREVQPNPDGLFDRGTFVWPWDPVVVGADGTAYLSAWDKRRTRYGWAMPPTGGGAQIAFAQATSLGTDSTVRFGGASADGRALVVEDVEGVGFTARVAPGGPIVTCPAGSGAYAFLGDDGATAFSDCGGRRIRVTAPIGDGQEVEVPLAAQVRILPNGWLWWPERIDGVDRVRVAVGGRVLDLTTQLGRPEAGVITNVLGVSRAREWHVLTRGGAGGVASWTFANRNPIRVVVTTAAGAPAAGVPVTVDPAAATTAPTRAGRGRVLRTDARGQLLIREPGFGVRLSAPGVCFAGPRGCATTLEVPVGLGPLAPVVALAGRGAARAPVIATLPAPVALVARRGALAIELRCLRAARCRGTAVLRVGRRVVARGTIGLAAQGRGRVTLRLVRGATLAKRARPARLTATVAGRSVVVRTTARRA